MSKSYIRIGRRAFLGGAALSLTHPLAGEPTATAAASEAAPAKEPREASAIKRLAFTVEEYRARVVKVQKALADQDLDALLVHNMASICYLTGLESIAAHKILALPPAGCRRSRAASTGLRESQCHGIFLGGPGSDLRDRR